MFQTAAKKLDHRLQRNRQHLEQDLQRMRTFGKRLNDISLRNFIIKVQFCLQRLAHTLRTIAPIILRTILRIGNACQV